MALLERFSTDQGLRTLGDAMPALNDVDGMVVIGVQTKADVDLEAIRAKVMDIVGEISEPQRWMRKEADRLRRLLDQVMFIGADVDTITLPPGFAKTMVRTNIELQRMTKSLVWGDFDAYRRRPDEVAADTVPAVMRRILAREAASVVRLGR